MATMQESAINGQIYEWANFRFTFAGQQVFRIKEFSANLTRDGATDVFGVGNKRVGQTFGNIAREGSMTVLLNEWNVLETALKEEAVKQGVSHFTECVFDIVMSARLTKKSPVRTVRYTGCSVRGKPFTVTQGGEPVAVQVALGIGDEE